MTEQERISRARRLAAEHARLAAVHTARAERWEEELRLQRAWERSPTYPGRPPRLTPDDVRHVRSLTPKWGRRVIADEAARLGLHPNTLYAIRAGRIYRDVT